MNLRRCAAQILTKVISDGQSLTAALDSLLPKIPDPKDRPLVQAMCYGVIRHYYQLEFLLAQLLTKPLKEKDADIKALLLLGLYQLQFMRIKSHAAVSETVAAAKHKVWAKSLINAVLRNYLRDSEALAASCAQHQASQLNHPDWIVQHIQQDWPDQAQAIFSANDQAAPLSLRVNQQKITRQAYLELLEQQGIAAEAAPSSPNAIILQQATGIEQLPGFQAGLVSVQDLAAQLAAVLLETEANQKVLDLCAAPGGKTAAILEQQADLHSLLAIDVEPQRLQRVTDNLQRLQLNAETLVADASEPQTWANGRQFQRILLDAPCSGLGVIRRHPDIKLLRRPTDIANLVALQAKILEAAWSLLSKDGLLLYATCSILKQENQQQIAAFLSRHADAEEIKITADWGIECPHGRQIITGHQQMDGFYYAKLRKIA